MDTFQDYWRSLNPQGKRQLERDTGYSYAFLCQVANGQKRAGLKTLTTLTRVRPDITPTMLRPDLFGGAWEPPGSQIYVSAVWLPLASASSGAGAFFIQPQRRLTVRPLEIVVTAGKAVGLTPW